MACRGYRADWLAFWQIVDDFGREHITLRKCLAHATWADVERGRTSVHCKIGNDLVDGVAKRGMRMHPRAADVDQAIACADNLAEELMRHWVRVQAMFWAMGAQDFQERDEATVPPPAPAFNANVGRAAWVPGVSPGAY